MFLLRNKKNNFPLRILNWGPVKISQSLVDQSLALYARDLFTLTIDLQPVRYLATNHYEHFLKLNIKCAYSFS